MKHYRIVFSGYRDDGSQNGGQPSSYDLDADTPETAVDAFKAIYMNDTDWSRYRLEIHSVQRLALSTTWDELVRSITTLTPEEIDQLFAEVTPVGESNSDAQP